MYYIVVNRCTCDRAWSKVMVLRAIYIVGSNPTKCIILAQGSFFFRSWRRYAYLLSEDLVNRRVSLYWKSWNRRGAPLLKILKIGECLFTEDLEKGRKEIKGKKALKWVSERALISGGRSDHSSRSTSRRPCAPLHRCSRRSWSRWSGSASAG